MKSDVQNRKDNMQDETTPKFDFVFGKRNYIFIIQFIYTNRINNHNIINFIIMTTSIYK